MQRLFSVLLEMLGWAAGVYIVLCIGLFFFQRYLLYFPDKTPYDPAQWQLPGFAAMPIDAGDGALAQSWYRLPQGGKPVVAFAHGNAGHFGLRTDIIVPWVEAGYGVALIGYPGYEGNAGAPGEPALYAVARGVVQRLQQQGIVPQRIVFYGESLGSGVAVQMATEFPLAGLILESPYTTIADVGAYHYPFLPVRLLARDRFDSLGKIGAVRVPVLIIHGEADAIVPLALGQRLFAAANEPKQLLQLPGLGHGYDMRQPVVVRAVNDFIDRLAPRD